MPLPHDPFASTDPEVVDAADLKPPPDVEVPKGTSAEVSDWVGQDKVRAQLALNAENETTKPRKGLVDDLKEILGT